MFYNSIGSVKVDGLLKLPRFFRRTFAARKAALATEGCVEVRLFRRGRQFFALSIWESPVAMKGYAQTSVHRTFMEHQERKYPHHKTIMAEGLLWGFSHMTIEGDTAEVTMMSVPDDGSSDISVNYVYEFKRRSHLNNE